MTRRLVQPQSEQTHEPFSISPSWHLSWLVLTRVRAPCNWFYYCTNWKIRRWSRQQSDQSHAAETGYEQNGCNRVKKKAVPSCRCVSAPRPARWLRTRICPKNNSCQSVPFLQTSDGLQFRLHHQNQDQECPADDDDVSRGQNTRAATFKRTDDRD